MGLGGSSEPLHSSRGLMGPQLLHSTSNAGDTGVRRAEVPARKRIGWGLKPVLYVCRAMHVLATVDLWKSKVKVKVPSQAVPCFWEEGELSPTRQGALL